MGKDKAKEVSSKEERQQHCEMFNLKYCEASQSRPLKSQSCKSNLRGDYELPLKTENENKKQESETVKLSSADKLHWKVESVSAQA